MALRFVPGMSQHDAVFMVIALVSGGAASVAMMALGANKNGRLELHVDRVVLGERALARQELRGKVVPWKQAHLWTTLGAAIHLEAPGGSLWIGGRDYLMATGGEGLSAHKVDASLSADDFAELVRCLELVPDPLLSTKASDALAIGLVPSSISLRGVGRTLWPWLATMALAGTIGSLVSMFPSLQAGPGFALVMVLVVLVVVGGIAFTVYRGMRPPPVRYQLLIQHRHVQLFDLRRPGAPIDPSLAPPVATRLRYRYVSRSGTQEFSVLRLQWPSKTIQVGVWDTSIRWSSEAPRAYRLPYLVGPEEWQRLVRALGVG